MDKIRRVGDNWQNKIDKIEHDKNEVDLFFKFSWNALFVCQSGLWLT
jgi:hypothetical protein